MSTDPELIKFIEALNGKDLMPWQKQFISRFRQTGKAVLRDVMLKYTIKTDGLSPYCRPEVKGFITMAQYHELIHATRLEF